MWPTRYVHGVYQDMILCQVYFNVNLHIVVNHSVYSC